MWNHVFLFNSAKLKMLPVTKITFTNTKKPDSHVWYVNILSGWNNIGFIDFVAQNLLFHQWFTIFTWNYHWHSVRISSHLSRTRTIGKGGRMWLLCLPSVQHVHTTESVKRKSSVSVSCVYSETWKRRNCESRVLILTVRQKIIIELSVLSAWLVERIIDK